MLWPRRLRSRSRTRLPCARAAALAAVAPLAAGIVLAGACSGAQDHQGPLPTPANAPRIVRVAAAAPHRLPRHVVVTGTLAPDDRVTLGFEVAGKVAEVMVDLGSRVARGEVLARLDPDDFELAVRQAEAALQQARALLGLPLEGEDDTVDPEQTAAVRQARAVLEEARLRHARAKELVEQDLSPATELETAQASLLVAESRLQDALEEVQNRRAILAQRRVEVAIARERLDHATLRAPWDGAVSQRWIAPGAFVSAGGAALALVKSDPLRLRLPVPEREAGPVRDGQTVLVTVEGQAEPRQGRVRRTSPAIDPQNRTLLVEVEVQNADGALRPGAFARGAILVHTDNDALCVPATALITFAGLDKVLVVRDGKTVEQRVRTGRRVDGPAGERLVEIVEGLTEGDPVVVEPADLTGGQPVTVAS